MPVDTFPYELPPLPYAYNALEPYIDAETMRIHYEKHYKAHIDNLNTVLLRYPKLQKLTLAQLLCRSYFLPQEDLDKILHNAGGIYNHQHFFQALAPRSAEGHKPDGLLAARIKGAFGSFDKFLAEFTAAALGLFGSGWACLAITPARQLKLYCLADQQTTFSDGARPILLLDMWEHAYYLKYKDDRIDYIKNFLYVAVYMNDKKARKPLFLKGKGKEAEIAAAGTQGV